MHFTKHTHTRRSGFISSNASFSRNLCVVGFVVKLSDSETTKPTARKLSAGMTCYANSH